MRFFSNKRRSKRKTVSIKAEFIPDTKIGYSGVLENSSPYGLKKIKWYKYFGVIENISKNGVCYEDRFCK